MIGISYHSVSHPLCPFKKCFDRDRAGKMHHRLTFQRPRFDKQALSVSAGFSSSGIFTYTESVFRIRIPTQNLKVLHTWQLKSMDQRFLHRVVIQFSYEGNPRKLADEGKVKETVLMFSFGCVLHEIPSQKIHSDSSALSYLCSPWPTAPSHLRAKWCWSPVGIWGKLQY